MHGVSEGALALLFTAVSSPATAQPTTPSAPAAASAAPVGSATPQPEAPAPAYGSAPPTQPAYGAAPAPTAPPQPAPAYAPPPQSFTGASYPPPEPYSAPAESSAEQDQGGDSKHAVRGLKAGPYFSAVFGIGAPFGGDTSTDPPAGFKQGAGGLATAGWAFIPNFGIDAFFHYKSAQMVLTSRNEDEFPGTSAYGLLYGLEARGIAGTGSLIGWASVGISLGTGKLSGTSNQSSFVVSPGGASGPSSTPIDGDLSFKPMPVLAFGAEVELIRGLSFGPHVRWYITSVSSACKSQNQPNVTGFDPNTGLPLTQDRTVTNCADSTTSLTVPDVLFVGLGLTYRVGM
jgi:hypothetical protein